MADETRAEHAEAKADRQDRAAEKVEIAQESLAYDAKPARESTDLKVQGAVILASLITFVALKVFHVTLAQDLANWGAGFVLAAGAAAWHWYKRTHSPVQVPIAGTKAAEPGPQ